MMISVVTTTYTYNTRNELLTESRNGYNAVYTYDGVGNRLTSEINGNPLSYTYDDDNRLTSSSDGKTYSYDDNGNVIEFDDNSDITRYEYDIENYLIKTVLPNNDTYEYLICPLGIRISKTTPSTTEYYGYDRGNRSMKYDPVGNTVSKYAQNPSEIDETLGYLSVPSWVYNTMDGLHTIRNEVDYGGNLLSQKDYDAYGVSIGNTPTEYGFTGRIFDPESSLYNYRARMYDPRVGRFMSQDPIGLINSYNSGCNNNQDNSSNVDIFPNLYIYCNNNPINNIDPSGMEVKFVNCNYLRRQRLRIGLKIIKGNLITGLPCIAAAISFNIYNCLWNRTNNLIIEGGGSGCKWYWCGYYQPGEKDRIHICTSGFLVSCGRLSRTIVHEMVHLCGKGEVAAYSITLVCG